jgi:hypothetical protein
MDDGVHRSSLFACNYSLNHTRRMNSTWTHANPKCDSLCTTFFYRKRRAARCSGGLTSLLRSNEGRHIQEAGFVASLAGESGSGGWGEYYKRSQVRKLFQRLDGWIRRRIWSHRYRRWRHAGWKQPPATKLYGEYELVRLLYLIPSLASWRR